MDKVLWVDSHGGLWTAGWRYELRWADVGREDFNDALKRGEVELMDGGATVIGRDGRAERVTVMTFRCDPEIARWAIERAHDRENGWD